ncbi:hypothetical protein M758_6G199100, partial [Ceratodon purpureus]
QQTSRSASISSSPTPILAASFLHKEYSLPSPLTLADRLVSSKSRRSSLVLPMKKGQQTHTKLSLLKLWLSRCCVPYTIPMSMLEKPMMLLSSAVAPSYLRILLRLNKQYIVMKLCKEGQLGIRLLVLLDNDGTGDGTT